MLGRSQPPKITKPQPLQARRARYLRPRLDFMMISGQRAKIEVVRPPLLAKKNVGSQIISMKSAAETFRGARTELLGPSLQACRACAWQAPASRRPARTPSFVVRVQLPDFFASHSLRFRRQIENFYPLRPDEGPAGEDRGGEAAARSEFAADDAPLGANGGDDVAEDFVDGVFVEDAEAAVGEEIHFQGFQLEAIFFRHVLDGDGAEVGETRLGTDGGVFGKACGDDVAGKLIRPSLKRGQFRVDAGASVLFGVVGHEGSSRPLYRGSLYGVLRPEHHSDESCQTKTGLWSV